MTKDQLLMQITQLKVDLASAEHENQQLRRQVERMRLYQPPARQRRPPSNPVRVPDYVRALQQRLHDAH